MKRFFYIFLYFFLVLGLSFTARAGQNDKNAPPFSIEEAVDYLDSFKLSLSSTDAQSDLITTPFGDIQVLSSVLGTDGQTKIPLVLNVHISSLGEITAPHMTIRNGVNVKDCSFFYPVPQPISPEQGISYYKNTALPFIIELKHENQAVEFDLVFELKWCQKDDCADIEYVIPVKLKAGYEHPSKYSAFIINSFHSLPKTVPLIRIHKYKKDTFWVSLDMDEKIEKTPTFMLLDDRNQAIDYTVVSESIDKNKGLFVIKVSALDKIKDVIVEIGYNVYKQKLNLLLQNLPTTDDIQNQNTKSIPFYLCLLFLLFSPVFALFLSCEFRNEIIVRPILKKQIISVSLGVLSGVIIYTIWPYDYLMHSKIWLPFCCLLFAFLSVKCVKLENYTYGLLAAILPYFSLFAGKNIQIPTSTVELFKFFAILTVLNALPFVVLYLKPFWAVRLSCAIKRSYIKPSRYSFVMGLILCAFVLYVSIANS